MKYKLSFIDESFQDFCVYHFAISPKAEKSGFEPEYRSKFIYDYCYFALVENYDIPTHRLPTASYYYDQLK